MRHTAKVLGRIAFVEAFLEVSEVRGHIPGQQEEAQLDSQEAGDDRDPTSYSNGDRQGWNFPSMFELREDNQTCGLDGLP